MIGRPLLAFVLLCSSAIAQEEPLPEGHSNHGEAFNDGPRQAGYVMDGQGNVDFPITTSEPEVQALFHQGVAQLHVFFYFEAERTFRQASMIEPGNPLPYWGMAMANANNADRAKKFLAVAREKVESFEISRREQLYLDALSAFYAEDGDDKSRRQDWLKGLEKIVQEFRDDLDARAWLAMVAWQNGRQDGIGSREAVSLMIDSVIDRNPLHPGAHHYKIHLWDHNDDAQALASAAKFAEASPGIAHAWHMPGHTYTNLKRFADAAYQQEGSARVDHAYMIRDRVMPFMIHNYSHNNQWLAENLTKIGRLSDAVLVSRNLVEQPRDPNKNNARSGGHPQREGRRRWSEALLTFEQYDALLDATSAGLLDWSDEPIEQFKRAHSLGLAHASRRDLPALDEQITTLHSLLPPAEDESAEDNSPNPDDPQPEASDDAPGSADPKADDATDSDDPKTDVPESDDPKANDDPEDGAPKADDATDSDEPNRRRRPRPLPGLESAIAELEGHRLLIDEDTDAALARFDAANDMRRESLARLLLDAGKTDEAIAKVKEAVERSPNEVAPLAAQVEILHAAGKTEEARAAYLALREVAREADPDLLPLLRVASIVDTWTTRDGWAAPPLEPRDDLASQSRIDLEPFGPITWSPLPAPGLEGVDTDGTTHRLEDLRGQNVLLLFYLGGDCAHCMEQLIAFSKEIERIRDTGTVVLAISTDSLERTTALKQNGEIDFAMPLLSDPSLASFKQYRAFDDFEAMPLHGTFLIDAAGDLRYQDISYQPFLDVDFVVSELSRINRLLGRSPSPVAASR